MRFTVKTAIETVKTVIYLLPPSVSPKMKFTVNYHIERNSQKKKNNNNNENQCGCLMSRAQYPSIMTRLRLTIVYFRIAPRCTLNVRRRLSECNIVSSNLIWPWGTSTFEIARWNMPSCPPLSSHLFRRYVDNRRYQVVAVLKSVAIFHQLLPT